MVLIVNDLVEGAQSEPSVSKAYHDLNVEDRKASKSNVVCFSRAVKHQQKANIPTTLDSRILNQTAPRPA